MPSDEFSRLPVGPGGRFVCSSMGRNHLQLLGFNTWTRSCEVPSVAVQHLSQGLALSHSNFCSHYIRGVIGLFSTTGYTQIDAKEQLIGGNFFSQVNDLCSCVERYRLGRHMLREGVNLMHATDVRGLDGPLERP